MTITARKATWLASLGAGLEYYDFIVYGMMVSYLNTLFFVSGEAWIDLMKGFAVFAVGYLARPFGGLLFGMIGDTFGRKETFVFIMLLMAIATFAVGLLPTYAQMGMTAAVLLIALRLLQGLSFGAELPGAITVVNEYADPKKTSIHSGFVISSVSLGSILASLILFILSKNIDKQQILDWGWRIPFLLGGLLALANYFIRKHLQETPAFANLQSRRPSAILREPLIQLWKNHRLMLAIGISMTVLVASLVIFNLYLPTYLSLHFQYQMPDIYLAMTYGLIWSAISLPICGFLADRFGRMKIFLFTCIAFGLIVFPLFHLLTFGGMGALTIFMMVYQTAISFLMASYFPLLAAGFPVQVRYTGIALCYNFVYAIMGSAPIAITFLIEKTNTPTAAIWFLIACAAISIAGILGKHLK
ncbi:MAG: hypothetical protein HW387_1228 [Parachlamydiales bacterium]|nr:hypothetical protein [Parachlamydiales bacterium]